MWTACLEAADVPYALTCSAKWAAMDPGTPGPALLLRKAQALVDRGGVETSEKGELSGKQAAAGVCRLARLKPKRHAL